MPARPTAKARSAPAKRTRMRRHEREQQLLNIAEKLFTEQGFSATSIEDIARAAGVTRPMLYDHFGDKDAVLLACARRARKQFEDAFVEAVSARRNREFAAIIEAGGDVLFKTLERDPRRWALLFCGTSAVSGRVSEQLNELQFATVQRITDILRQFAPNEHEERLQATAHAISGVGEQLGRWWLRTSGIPRRRLLGHYRDFVLGGLLAMRDAPAARRKR